MNNYGPYRYYHDDDIVTAIALEDDMGQKHNRKRTRHRPSRTRRAQGYQPAPIQPPLLQPTLLAYRPQGLPTRRLIDWQYTKHDPINTFTDLYTGTACVFSAYHQRRLDQPKFDDLGARERRIFGGVEGEKDDEDLKGRMLDVVVGLFKGVNDDGLN